jgi:hypothetical protein
MALENTWVAEFAHDGGAKAHGLWTNMTSLLSETNCEEANSEVKITRILVTGAAGLVG